MSEARRTDVLYLSSAPSPQEFDAMKAARKPGAPTVVYGMAEANFKFHSLLQRGLVADEGTHVHSLVGRSVTAHSHRGWWWRGTSERLRPKHTIDHLGFPNLPGLRQAWLSASFSAKALAWRLRTRRSDRRVLIVDAAYITALPGVLRVLSGGTVARVGIVADLYSFMADVQDAGRMPAGRKRDLARRAAENTYRHLDGFVLLTEQMNGPVNPEGKPHMVMEGVVDSTVAALANSIEAKSSRPRFLYAGALRREYGAAALVEGFRALPDDDVELHIYGDGPYAAEVVQAAAADPRIVFHGLRPLAEVVAEEVHSWVLVNPRPASAEFTKYSFPSKNMEYLASGTAVMTTRLPGMPPEYYAHVLAIDDGADGVTRGMAAALETSLADLHALGTVARDFVLAEKSEVRQAARILDFADGLSR